MGFLYFIGPVQVAMFRATSAALMFRSSAVLLEQESWRDNKVTYLQYLNVCTETLHSVLKPAAAAKYKKFSEVGYQSQDVVLTVRQDVPKNTEEFGRFGPATKKVEEKH